MGRPAPAELTAAAVSRPGRVGK